jgi:hypothetical protein
VHKQRIPNGIDISLYPNRWIAIVRGRVVGAGLTPQQARRAARQTRPKDKMQLFFVDTEESAKQTDVEE